MKKIFSPEKEKESQKKLEIFKIIIGIWKGYGQELADRLMEIPESSLIINWFQIMASQMKIYSRKAKKRLQKLFKWYKDGLKIAAISRQRMTWRNHKK